MAFLLLLERLEDELRVVVLLLLEGAFLATLLDAVLLLLDGALATDRDDALLD